jgi:SSS family solute:Na+ symporter
MLSIATDLKLPGLFGKLRLPILSAVGFLTSISPVLGADGQAAEASGLHWIDWVIICVYALVVVWIGYISSKRKGTTSDYFIGGKGIGSTVIGISMFVTLYSTISYLNGPGEMVRYGWGKVIGDLVAAPFGYLFVFFVLIPVLMRKRVVSAYQLLEDQLGPHVRTLGAVIFIFMRMVWMAVLIHFGSVAIGVILNLDSSTEPVVKIAIGLIAITYTTMGGLRAVMITDTIQFFILFSGVIATILVVTLHFKGFSWIPNERLPHWEDQPLFSWDLTVRVTIIGAIIQSFFFDIMSPGSDQTQIQRYMATTDIREARRAILVRMVGLLSTTTLLAIMGLALVSFYSVNSSLLPEGKTFFNYGDQIFPYFIAHELPVGVSGLVVAALFAAAMSSVDSGVNSITAVFMTDFLDRYHRPPESEEVHKRIAKRLAFTIGIIVISVSMLVPWVPGNFVEVTARTIQVFIPILFGIFCMAFFVRWSTPFGVLVGTCYGVATGIIVPYWEVFTGQEALSFILYVPIIFIGQFIPSCILSWLPTRGKSPGVLFGMAAVVLLPLALIIVWIASL